MRYKHVPQRTCIACRQIRDKRQLVRIVSSEEGIKIDRSGKIAGRGAYIDPRRSCWRIALKSNRLETALRTRLSTEDNEKLAAYMTQLDI